ncbi:short transient receptor potential channel 4-like [Styela clava]
MSNKSSTLSIYDNKVDTTSDDDNSSNCSQGFGEYIIQGSEDEKIQVEKIKEAIAMNGKETPPGYSYTEFDEMKDTTMHSDDEYQTEKKSVNNPIVVKRNSADPTGDARASKTSFKMQARLSRMLENADTSSSSDDELYTYTQDGQINSEEDLTALEENLQRYTADIPSDPLGTSRQERIPMHVPSKGIDPNALIDVKSRLKKVKKTISGGGYVKEQSPATIWELKKNKRDAKLLLNKAQASKLKAGWKVRQCLHNLPEGETVNTLYLTLVRKGMLKEVDALFSLAKVARAAKPLNKNFKDADEKSALTIAIDNKNETMMTRLLEHGVKLDLNIFHAVEADFIEGMKILMLYDPCTQAKIAEENPYFQIGMTPMLLAAHNNNYRMLSLLHEYGHQLPQLKDWSEGIQEAWESANERRMICEARAQPAFITLTTELNRMNPMKYCMQEIRKVRVYAKQEQEFSNFYKGIISKIEDYMCSLLDFICSSEELANLFQFEYLSPSLKPQDKLKRFIESTRTKRYELENRFKLLERASKEELIRFVTHQQSQLALTYLRFRSLPFLQNNFISIPIGLLFPVLSLLYVFAPNTVLGSIITLPTISFNCHMISDVVFAILLLLNIALKDVDQDRLGAGPTTVELLIFIWILGKWVQEMQECINRGLKEYLRDKWNYSDLLMLLLFSTTIGIRIFDMVYNKDASTSIERSEWNHFEPRLIAGGLNAWAYVFFFIRLLGLMRVDRTLGPLQISLAKMLNDIIRFLCIFTLVIFAFAFGLSDLYWYYGTKEGSKMFCAKGVNTAVRNGTCITNIPPFTTMPGAITQLFWALFGLFELNSMSLDGKHTYTEFVGKTLVATYHVVAIIVMLNMLIAMMSNSYDDTRENEETAWKFHRTSMWIRFIRREVVRPPPMNLFPNPWRILENSRRFRNFVRRKNCCKNPLTRAIYDIRGRRVNRSRSINEVLKTMGKGVGDQEKVELTGERNINDRRQFVDVDGKTNSRPNIIRSRNEGFTIEGLEEAKNAVAAVFNIKGPKSVSMRLVRRYKLKHLVKKRVVESPSII